MQNFRSTMGVEIKIKVDQNILFVVFLSILNNSVTMHRTLGLAGHEIMALNSFLTETTISLTLENETSSTQYNSSVQQWCGAMPPPLDGASVAPYALRYSAVQCSVALTFKPKLTYNFSSASPRNRHVLMTWAKDSNSNQHRLI